MGVLGWQLTSQVEDAKRGSDASGVKTCGGQEPSRLGLLKADMSFRGAAEEAEASISGHLFTSSLMSSISSGGRHKTRGPPLFDMRAKLIDDSGSQRTPISPVLCRKIQGQEGMQGASWRKRVQLV